MLALKRLAAEHPVNNIHFWGKIFGVEKDYIIAQCVYKEGEEPQPSENDIENDAPAADEAAEEGEGDDQPPKSAFVKPRPVPTEEYGTGVNKYVNVSPFQYQPT